MVACQLVPERFRKPVEKESKAPQGLVAFEDLASLGARAAVNVARVA